MPSISFIYKTRNNPNAVYTGKYVYEGLLVDNQAIDVFVKKELLDCLNNYRFNRGYREIRNGEINVGILSVMDTVNFNTYRECKAFDFYFYNNVFFLNGRKLHISNYQSCNSNQQSNDTQTSVLNNEVSDDVKADTEISTNEMP
jgi:hypothetical protein